MSETHSTIIVRNSREYQVSKTTWEPESTPVVSVKIESSLPIHNEVNIVFSPNTGEWRVDRTFQPYDTLQKAIDRAVLQLESRIHAEIYRVEHLLRRQENIDKANRQIVDYLSTAR